MYNLNSVIQVVRWYFQGNVLLITALLALLYWARKTTKRKQYLLCAVVCFWLICNDLVLWFAKKADETDTFYRVLWILPVTLLSAYLIVELADQLKGIRKGILILLTVLFVLNNAVPSFKNWVNLPDNVYQIDAEWIEIADLIDAHSGGRRVNVIDDYSVLWYAREYDDNLCMLGIDEDVLRAIMQHTEMSFGKEDVQAAVSASAIDYIIIRKEKTYGNASLAGADFALVGSSENYNVYYTNWRNGF